MRTGLTLIACLALLCTPAAAQEPGPGGKKKVQFTLTPRQFSVLDAGSRRVVEEGFYEVSVGGKQPGFTGSADASTTDVALGRFLVRAK